MGGNVVELLFEDDDDDDDDAYFVQYQHVDLEFILLVYCKNETQIDNVNSAILTPVFVVPLLNATWSAAARDKILTSANLC
jgi:hypothetical protein